MSNHWYDMDGNPVWEVTGKNGKKRPPTVRDARKHNLCPSVTTVLKVLDAPELNKWKINQILKACKEYPYVITTKEQFNKEGYKTYEEGIKAKAFAKSTDAVDFGKTLHKYMEEIARKTVLSSEAYPSIPQATKTAINDVLARKIDQIIAPEKGYVDKDLGVAGTLDLLCVLKDGRTCVVDYKNQSTLTESGEPKKIVVYEKTLMQVCQYAKMSKADCAAVLTVSKDEPGRLEWYDVPEEEFKDSIDMFAATTKMYRLSKKLRKIKENEE
jgi:hypothetical protein